MARMRSVKPEFWDDQELAEATSRDARLCYIGLWNLADEHSRLRGDGRSIKGKIFPYDDDLSATDVERLLDQLAGAGKIVRYRVGGAAYLFLPNLARHQRLDSEKVPSRLPAPPLSPAGPDPDPKPSGPHPDSSGNFPDSSEPHPDRSENFPDESENLQTRVRASLKHVAGSMEHVAGLFSADEPAPRSRAAPTKRGTRIPDDFAPDSDLLGWAREKVPTLDIRRETEKFITYWQGRSGQGATKVDWRATWRNWMLNAVDRMPARTSPRLTLVETGGMRLRPELAAQVADHDRWVAEDERRHAIGPAP